MLGNVQKLGFVTDVTSPYNSGLISKDGTIGLATVQLDATPRTSLSPKPRRSSTPPKQPGAARSTCSSAARPFRTQKTRAGAPADFIVGAVLALVVLFFAFRRSVLSALLPLLSALVAIGIGTSFIAILSHAFSVPQFATQLAELIALGVGVDYALFIVNRHRRELLAGRSPEEAVVRALNTSGRAVLVAGLTVCIALLGMFALGPHLPLWGVVGSGVRGLPHHAVVDHAAAGHAGLLRLQSALPPGPAPAVGRGPIRRWGRRPGGQPLLDQVGEHGRSPLGPAQAPSAWL